MRERAFRVILARMDRGGTVHEMDRRAYRRWALAVLAVVLLSTLVLGNAGGAATTYDGEERRFLSLLNEYREQNGLEPVVLSDTLAVAAERHSKDMAEYGFFAHDTERSSYYPAGSEPWDRMEAEGYTYNTHKGENLAVGYESADEAMQAWKNSSSHNAAMLDGDYKVMGVARINVPGSIHGWYWTTDFGGHVDPSAHAAGESFAPQKPPAAPEDPPAAPRPAATDRGGVANPLDTPALDNGAMGKVGGWTQRSKDGADLVVDEGYARLGGYHDGADELSQKIFIGRDARLAYDLRIRTKGNQRNDTMLVRLTDLKGKQISVLEKHTGREEAGWGRERVDLSRYAGRTLLLSFRAETDAEGLTAFRVDRVALRP